MSEDDAYESFCTTKNDNNNNDHHFCDVDNNNIIDIRSNNNNSNVLIELSPSSSSSLEQKNDNNTAAAADIRKNSIYNSNQKRYRYVTENIENSRILDTNIINSGENNIQIAIDSTNNNNIDQLLRKSRTSINSSSSSTSASLSIQEQNQSIEDDYNDDAIDNENDDNDDDDDDGPKRKRIRKNLLNTSSNSDNNNNHNQKVNVDNNNNNNNNNAQQKSTTILKQDNNNNINLINMEVRFLVSSRDAGAIIGRGGSNITHLRQTYESSITVPDCLSPERILTIVANVDKIIKIVREILKFIDSTISPSSNSSITSNLLRSRIPVNKTNRKTSIPVIGSDQRSSSRNGSSSSSTTTTTMATNSLCEIRLLLHTSHAGGLIGKGGARITQLREETKAGIKVYSECCPQSTERVCAVTGPIDIVTNAVGIILNLIRTFPIKGPNQLYNPAHFDPFMSLRYGGFGETTAGPLTSGPHCTQQSVHPPPPVSHHEPSRTNSIFTPPPIPPPPPTQYHHPAPPIHHPHAHHHHAHPHPHHHHNPFSSPSATGSRHLSTLTNGPPPSQTHHHHLMDHGRSPSDFGATSPSFLAAAAAAAHHHHHWPQAANTCPAAGSSGVGGGRMATIRAAAVAAAAAGNSGPLTDVFGTTSDDPFRWITDAKHYDTNRLQNTLMKRDDVSFIINPNGTAISTIKVNHKVVGAIIGRGGNRIKEIRIKTQADISIDQMKSSGGGGGGNTSSSAGSTRSITVKGLYNDVQAAVSMICNW
ncbi:hypothetical protein DERF_010454 [Dermatophagoides farinae]|uniref:K Homology domain-containing protein n=1 Tax=Dermatophagoides farinae TaxID=6954 RepID=A0A922I1C6_DERFA|nr:hypothetical protein DERF_010454 [Dermatophagoides farinae]